MLTIRSTCSQCKKVFTWNSQPFMLGKFPAGNLLLSFSILCSGASINKILLVFRQMGVLVYHYPTYFYHQRHLLVPSIVKYWRGYQADLLAKLAGKEAVIAGDGRHDSMGHSAKYGTYTIFCCTIGYIIHIVLVQVLRVAVCKDRELAVSDPFGESLIFCPKLALGRLFSKIIFKSSNDFVYLWKLRKIKSAVKMRSECGFLVDQKVRWWTSAEVLKWTQLTSK